MIKLWVAILIFLGVCSTCLAEDSARDIQSNFHQLCKTQQFSGVILIAEQGKIILEDACGIANRNFQIPNNVNTKFNLGSVGKLFTSVAIAQLVQQHKITLDTSICKIIPDWVNDKRACAITIQQLLIHAAGLGSYMNDQHWKLGADSGLYVHVADYRPLIQSDKLLFNPGSSQSYSNNGYILLGAIIEAITHKNYNDYLQENIFSKADMKNTGLFRLDEIVENQSVGYSKTCIKNQCQWKNNNYEVAFSGSPAGGAYSTAEDLFRFTQSLPQHRLLNDAFSNEVLSSQIVSPSQNITVKKLKIDGMDIFERVSPYGYALAWNKYGFAVWENPILLGHTGGGPGTCALLATSPDNQYTIVILSNIDGPGMIILYKKIREALGLPSQIENF